MIDFANFVISFSICYYTLIYQNIAKDSNVADLYHHVQLSIGSLALHAGDGSVFVLRVLYMYGGENLGAVDDLR